MMNIKNQLAILLLVVAVCMAGCTNGELTVESNEDDNQLVPVQVMFETTPMQSPLSSVQESATRGEGQGSAVRSKQNGAVKMELVEAPQTRAAINENTIYALWVLQFDGKTVDSKLKYKKYITAAPFTNLQLVTGINQRVVTIANASADAFASYVVGTTTYGDLEADAKDVTSSEGALCTVGSSSYIPMKGTYDGDILPGGTISLSLTRTLAKVAMIIKLGSDFSGTTFSELKVQLADVPSKSYWLCGYGVEPFPVSSTPVTNYSEKSFLSPTAAGTYSTDNLYIPVNMRGTVSGTTGKTRRSDAPKNATYMKITLKTTTGDNFYYYLHLGENFTTDYNLKPNYQYTYSVTLNPDPDGTDSRLEKVSAGSVYVGRFGGELKKNAEGVWQFTKDLWVSGQNDSPGIAWAPNNSKTDIIDKADGKANSLKLAQLGQPYAANWTCWMKNGSLDASTTTTADLNFKWFLPAQNQLIAVWSAYKSFTASFDAAIYWTSTEFFYDNTASDSGLSTWYVNFGTGDTMRHSKTTGTSRVRCVREM